MKIMDFLSPETLCVPLSAKTKKEVIEDLVDVLIKAGKLTEKKKVIQVLMDREEMGSTGIGQGIAIPHGKTDSVQNLTAAFGVSQSGIPFDALDGEPVHLVFLLVAPEWQAGAHLKALARIAAFLKDKQYRRTLLTAKTPGDVLKVIEEEEKTRQ
jgi:PTS system nitrogen regulatory IIA component